jgi:hypothetical protein
MAKRIFCILFVIAVFAVAFVAVVYFNSSREGIGEYISDSP